MDELSTALTEYRNTGSPEAFETVYALTSRLRSFHAYKVRSSGLGDDNDALTLFDDTLLNVLQRPITVGFTAYFAGALRNSRASFIRTKLRDRNRTYTFADNPDDPGAPTPELFIEYSTPEIVYLDAERKKRAASVCAALLTDPDSGLSPRMTAIIADLPNHRTINRLADANGIHHSYIFRSLTKLSRRYDANRHGDIRDII